MKMKITVLALAMAITPQTRATIHRAFRADDFDIVWTQNPSEAIEASAFREPGLMVLDMGRALPTERAILENLRTLNPGTPMLVLTEPSAQREAEFDQERVAVLRKPVEPVELATAANTLLRASALPRVHPAVWASSHSETVLASEQFRDMLQARYDAPFDLAPSYRHWGINE
jgi:DNA-binding response OmpR family regulator